MTPTGWHLADLCTIYSLDGGEGSAYFVKSFYRCFFKLTLSTCEGKLKTWKKCMWTIMVTSTHQIDKSQLSVTIYWIFSLSKFHKTQVAWSLFMIVQLYYCRPASCPSNRQKVSRALHSNLNIFKIDQNSVRLLKVFPHIVEITKILIGLESLTFKVSLECTLNLNLTASLCGWISFIYRIRWCSPTGTRQTEFTTRTRVCLPWTRKFKGRLSKTSTNSEHG